LGAFRIANEFILKCYRLKCGESAKLWLVEGDAPAITSGFEPRPYLNDLTYTSNAATQYMQRYGLRDDTLELFDVRQVIMQHALYLPVRGPTGSNRGGTVRRFDAWGKKVDSYKIADEPWQAWYRRKAVPRGTVIVEDQLSAMRCWQLGWHSVALLGTHLSVDRAEELQRYVTAPVLLALDADAFGDACQLAKQHAWIDRAVLLERDIKDCSDTEVEARLG
jgi:hypothetical protein